MRSATAKVTTRARTVRGKRQPTHVQTVRRVALALLGVEEGPCYGTPGFRVRGRFLARLWEDVRPSS